MLSFCSPDVPLIGDSGAPVVMEGTNQFVGIHIFGITVSIPDVMGWYKSIALNVHYPDYTKWILDRVIEIEAES